MKCSRKTQHLYWRPEGGSRSHLPQFQRFLSLQNQGILVNINSYGVFCIMSLLRLHKSITLCLSMNICEQNEYDKN